MQIDAADRRRPRLLDSRAIDAVQLSWIAQGRAGQRVKQQSVFDLNVPVALRPCGRPCAVNQR